MKVGKAALGDTLKRQILTLELEPDQDLDEVQLNQEYETPGRRCGTFCGDWPPRDMWRSAKTRARGSFP